MKIRSKLLLLVLVVIMLGCKTSSKTTVSETQIKALDELLAQKSFEIRSDWALPLATNSMNSIANAGLLPPGNTAGRISLIGNSNYLRMKGDRIEADLPYFGERQMGGGYNPDGDGIKFEGTPEEYKVTQGTKAQNREITFKMRNKAEAFMVSIVVSPNLSSTIRVSSSQRFPIRYTGLIEAISEE